MLGPIIVGERVRLAPPTEEMCAIFLRWMEDLEVTQYLGILCPPSLEGEKEWLRNLIKSEKEILWAVYATDRDEERLIGTTAIHGIHPINHKAVSGNLIGEKSEWGKGYASEVVRLRTRFAFEELNLQKISTEVVADNIGSRRVLEKAGYRQIGVARRHIWRKGKWHDMWLAEILREDWEARMAQELSPTG